MLQTLRKFFAFCGAENRKMFITSIWLGVVSAICSAMRISAAAIVIQALLNRNVTMRTLWTSLCMIVISLIITIIINMRATMLQTRAGYRACANKRIEIAEHLRYLPMGWFNDNSLGEVTAVTTNTMENMANIATRVVMVTTRGFLTSGIIAVMLLFFDWRMGLITLAGLVLFFTINAAMQRAEQTLAHRKFNADERLVSKVLEYVQGIAEVKNFDLTHDSTTQVHNAVEEVRKASFAMEIPSVLYMLVQFVINKLTGIAVCTAAILFYFGGTMTLTNCLLMLICSFILFEQLDSAGSFSSLFRSIDIGVDKANAILNVVPMDIDGEDQTPKREDIALSHVNFSYDSKSILQDVSLTIPEKTTVAIVGPSGSGKTTLCNLMARFWDVQSGSVSLGGRDVREYSYDSLIRNFSFVFQRTYLFSDTIANNIRFGRPDATLDEVKIAAKKARCYDFIMALPDNFDTVIGEGGATLSGGERQRISIARAIMKNAPIIILDEATANVDPENEKELMEAVSELTHDKTVIMIVHRLKTVQNADMIFVVDHGKIVQQGTHDELVAADGLYRRFVVERKQAAGWKV
ncbi:ABC transporter ATP-binding protein [uncultured Ruminococcus sp.]|uniref:ABC transporter ATP-binding protein n=1 Tax=uncultured Ruminococcus sp. TaxID=165186 RepID=UPI0025D94B68|nr:ABC transporter ATP-binding protein [uncultured Ruminococcus sp.]